MKQLSRLAVERPVTFTMMALIIIGFGLFGLNKLRLNLYPDVSFPTVTIYTTYEGVAPEDMETLITRSIEKNVGSVGGVIRVRSISSQGASVVKLYFNWGTDLYQAESDVRKRLDMVRRAIPDDAEQPIVFSYDPNTEPVVVLTLTSKVRNPRDLRTIATQQLEQRFERITGVASAETSGGFERRINIRMSNERMRTYNVDIATVANKLRAENIQVPAGELIEDRMVFSLRTLGEFKSVEQIANTIILVSNNQPIYLRDIADVEDGIAQPIGNVHIDGEDGVIINIYKQSDSNIVTTAKSILAGLPAIKRTLPSDVQLEVLTNKADFIELSIQNLIMTGLQAIILVVIILLIFLRSGRSALIIAISIPVSVIATFSIMDFADLSLNVISLSGLTLAVGMVVDNAVVVLENIFHFKEEGHETKKAAILGAQEVAIPVVVSTLTTVVVFLPILFVPGIAGFLFRDLALTISFALGISTLVALTLIPLMSSKFYSDKTGETIAKEGIIKRLLDGSRGNFAKRLGASLLIAVLFIPLLLGKGLKNLFAGIVSFTANRIAPWFTRKLEQLESAYSRQLDKALRRSGLIFGGSLLLFAGSLPLFNYLGGEFFPPVDENAFILEIQREAGVSLFELERTIYQVENVIRQEVPEARLVVSDFGDKIGVEGADNPGGNRGMVRVELIPTSQRKRSQFDITADLLEKLEVIPGAEIKEVRENPLSPDGENGLVIQIFGYDMVKRKEITDVLRERLEGIPGFSSITSNTDDGRPELRVIMDRERISRLNMTTSQVANALANSIKGNLATTFVDKGIEFQVLVELDPMDKAQSTAINDIQIRTPQGTWMPLSNLARIERYEGPSNVVRVNQERLSEIQVDLAGIDLKTAAERARNVLNSIEWPEGYRYELGGSAEDQAESFYFLMIAFLVAGILTYMVMASQFESLIEPLIIIFTIPLALTGVLMMLFITSTPISVTSMVGLILLSGIVVNNGIVMIDYIKILQARGLERHEAIRNGATRRLRPILMTAFTTVLSMVPLALEIGSGSETWSPMARTVIGGLTMSTLLMLFAVPCMYNIVNRLVESLGFDAIHKIDPLSEGNDDEDDLIPPKPALVN